MSRGSRTIVISYVPPGSSGVLVDFFVTGALEPSVALPGTHSGAQASIEFMTHRLPSQSEFDSEYAAVISVLSELLLDVGVRRPILRTVLAFLRVQLYLRWRRSRIGNTWGRLVASFNTTTAENRGETS